MLHSNLKILLVEDAEITRRIVREMLEQNGYSQIHEASNGAEAWGVLQRAIEVMHPFQLVIADWSMPQMTGIDLLRKLQSAEEYRRTPFILLTSHNEKTKVMEAIRAGVGHYLVKPFSADALQKKMREALSKK